MFELSVALKYLIPRWRQLSVSIISLISVIVIALVVWLILVFFSVANGLEKGWIDKLVAMTAPVRINPTDEYYKSYYFNIDRISETSDYSLKSLAEKKEAGETDPYDSSIDENVPSYWPAPDLDASGNLKDLVKEAFQIVESVPGVKASDFEMTMGNMRLRLARNGGREDHGYINHAAILGSFDAKNPNLKKNIQQPSNIDIANLLETLALSSDNIIEESSHEIVMANTEELRQRVRDFFNHVSVATLQTPPDGWVLPRKLLPESAVFEVIAVMRGSDVLEMRLFTNAKERKTLEEQYREAGYKIEPAKLYIAMPHINLELTDRESIIQAQRIPLIMPGNFVMEAKVSQKSLANIHRLEDLKFQVAFHIQKVHMEGNVSYYPLSIAKAEIIDHFDIEPVQEPYWVYTVQSPGGEEQSHLPIEHTVGEGVLLPRNFRDVGVLLGDRGFVSYYIATASSLQEQRIPVYVAGFYDHGIIPIGGKLVLTGKGITSTIRSAHQQIDQPMNTGINVRFTDVGQAETIRNKIRQSFVDKGIDRYWTVQTFHEFEFARDILQQMRSDKNLFSIIAGVIIIVACSNIVSMLVILVNDKKIEIGILRAMGATSGSIAIIFGLCGMIMGLVGSVIGILMAVLTLNHIDSLIALISQIQGYEMFNVVFYGETLPNELSGEALGFVLIATVVTSLLAGVIPAVKASLVRPSVTLRSA